VEDDELPVEDDELPSPPPHAVRSTIREAVGSAYLSCWYFSYIAEITDTNLAYRSNFYSHFRNIAILCLRSQPINCIFCFSL
jgi:hypothetical protein